MSTTNSLIVTKMLLIAVAVTFLLSANNAFALRHLDERKDTDSARTEVRKVDVQRVDAEGDQPQPVRALDRVKSFGSGLIKSADERKEDEERNDTLEKKDKLRRDTANRASNLRSDIENKKAQLDTRTDEKRADLEERKSDRAEELERRKAELENKRVEREAEIDERRQEREEKLTERAKKRVEAYVSRLVNRMTAAVERLSELMERVDSRIAKFEERGVDVSEANRLSVVAKEEIRKADLAVKDAAQSVRDALSRDNPQDQRDVINSKFRTAKDAIIEAHASIVSVIRALKASVDPNDTDNSDTEN